MGPPSWGKRRLARRRRQVRRRVLTEDTLWGNDDPLVPRALSAKPTVSQRTWMSTISSRGISRAGYFSWFTAVILVKHPEFRKIAVSGGRRRVSTGGHSRWRWTCSRGFPTMGVLLCVMFGVDLRPSQGFGLRFCNWAKPLRCMGIFYSLFLNPSEVGGIYSQTKACAGMCLTSAGCQKPSSACRSELTRHAKSSSSAIRSSSVK